MDYRSGYIISLRAVPSDVFTETGIRYTELSCDSHIVLLVICSIYSAGTLMYDVNPEKSFSYETIRCN